MGFLSFGVYSVNSPQDWQIVVASIKNDIKKYEGLFPLEVMDSSRFIIEEIIEGEEFAVDVYFDEDSKPVILNILKHPFVTKDDVSDRVYISSKNIILNNLSRFEELLQKMANIFALKNFPLHVEMRGKGDEIALIEGNPMRFAGWCTTDLAYYSYGINIYEYYFKNKKPDWDKILEGKDDEVYYFAMAEIPKNIASEEIETFDYDGFMKNISCPLDVRKINFKIHPLFAIVFARAENYNEVENILKLDMNRFIIRKA